jgi:hypothetical protein
MIPDCEGFEIVSKWESYMNEPNKSEIFCRYEEDNFPSSEFSNDPEWGKVHEVEPRHTVLGSIVGRESNGPRIERE